jgi:WD40 repeat protein
MVKRSKTSRKWVKWLGVGLLAVFAYLAWVQLFYRSPRVNPNGIFVLKNVIPAHNSYIWTVKFSPAGNVLASGSVDSTVKIWNVEHGSLLNTFKQPSGITYLTYSPDGGLIATGAYDGKIRLWRSPDGMLAKTFIGGSATTWCVDFSADGKMVAGAGEDKAIKVWNMETGQLIFTLTGHDKNIWDIKFSPAGDVLASGSFDKTIKIWDLNSGKLLHTLSDHSEAVVSLAFSPDGKWLASTGDDRSVKLWNTSDWKMTRSMTVPEHVQASAFSPDNKLLLTGGRDKPAIGEFLQNLFGNSKYNKGVSMRLWDVATGNLLQTFDEHANDVNDVSWSTDGKYIASGSSDRTIELWMFKGR